MSAEIAEPFRTTWGIAQNRKRLEIAMLGYDALRSATTDAMIRLAIAALRVPEGEPREALARSLEKTFALVIDAPDWAETESIYDLVNGVTSNMDAVMAQRAVLIEIAGGIEKE